MGNKFLEDEQGWGGYFCSKFYGRLHRKWKDVAQLSWDYYKTAPWTYIGKGAISINTFFSFTNAPESIVYRWKENEDYDAAMLTANTNVAGVAVLCKPQKQSTTYAPYNAYNCKWKAFFTELPQNSIAPNGYIQWANGTTSQNPRVVPWP